MSATMMSALYMTAAKMAVVGLVRRMMLSASSAGYNGTNNAGDDGEVLRHVVGD